MLARGTGLTFSCARSLRLQVIIAGVETMLGRHIVRHFVESPDFNSQCANSARGARVAVVLAPPRELTPAQLANMR